MSSSCPGRRRGSADAEVKLTAANRDRPAGAQAGRASPRPAGVQRQELAIARRGRPSGAHPAVGRRCRGRQGVAGGGQRQLSGLYPGRMELALPGPAAGTAGTGADRAGLVRRRRARADRERRARGRAAHAAPAGRAAGSLLRLAVSPSANPERGTGAHPTGAGVRRRRRHHRPQPDQGRHARRPAATDPHRGRQSSDAGRRQYGPGARASGRNPPGAIGTRASELRACRPASWRN